VNCGVREDATFVGSKCCAATPANELHRFASPLLSNLGSEGITWSRTPEIRDIVPADEHKCTTAVPALWTTPQNNRPWINSAAHWVCNVKRGEKIL
jgi:hypothetical protein